MKTASRESLRALDALNLVLADVRDGLGPYLAIYLATKHWDPSRIGMAMSAMGVAGGARPDPGREPDRPDPAQAILDGRGVRDGRHRFGRDGAGADASR